MAPRDVHDSVGLLNLAIELGLVRDGAVCLSGKHRELERFATYMIGAGKEEELGRKEAHEDEQNERAIAVAAGVHDYGQDDYVDVNTDEGYARLTSVLSPVGGGNTEHIEPSCFAKLCKFGGVSCSPSTYSASELSTDDLLKLAHATHFSVGYTLCIQDTKLNHVVPVSPQASVVAVTHAPASPDDGLGKVYGVLSPRDFFSVGCVLYATEFYFDEENSPVPPDSADRSQLLANTGFGADVRSRQDRTHNPPPPESVVAEDIGGGSSNLSGGVVRPKRRVIKARGNYDMSSTAHRTYNVSDVTMFNNIDELYLNTISREYAQEIIEELFAIWALPIDQPTTMKYAEDALWAFLIARTASNKADYKVEMSVPTKSGSVLVDFDKFSRMLADKYGVTRRNFARGVADDLRGYLRREENQFLRSRSAQRIGADPQMGDLCFDGSTGCTSMTSSEASFTRLLEARNLYERDDVLAEGASDRLMQGIHGGVRSIVPR